MEFQVKPRVTAQGTYTDNENQSATNKSGDVIAEVTPGISIATKGVRTNANLDYALRKQESFTRDIDQLSHQVQGNGDIALVKNYVNFFGTGNLSQRRNQVNRSILSDESLEIDDVANVGAASAGLTINNHVKRYFDGNFRYVFNTTKSNSTTFADSNSHNVTASLKNGRTFNRLRWGGDARYDELDTDDRELQKIAEVTGKLGYSITKLSGFDFSAGYESNPQYSTVNRDAESKGYIATASAYWQSPQQIVFSALYGQRAFGETYEIKGAWESSTSTIDIGYGRQATGDSLSLQLQQQIGYALITAGYNETLSDYSYSNRVNLPQSQNNTPLPLTTITETGTFVTRRASSSLSFTGVKNILTFTADYETRDFVESGTDSRTYRAGIFLENKISTLARLQLNADAVDANDPAISAVGLYTSVRLSYTHTIQKVFIARISAQQWELSPDSGKKILVNTLSASLSASF